MKSDTRAATFEVAPGEWALVAAAGTCSAVERVAARAGEVIEVILVITCVE